MTDFKYVEYVDEWGDESWKIETRKKFPSGMTGVLAFEAVDELTDGTICLNVNLDVRRKRKKPSGHREMTGRDGLEPASWVLQAMTEFEEYWHLEVPLGPARIEAGADDERRWKIYERILTRRGYTATMVCDQRTLVKRIGGTT